MNQRQLEAFRATMIAGSVTGAAERLQVSQPSVSRLVSDLEQDLGFDLFLRIGRGLTATVEGRRFYQAVEGMFIGLDRLNEVAETIRTTNGGVVTVGITPSLSGIEAPAAAAAFHRQHPDATIALSTGTSAEIVNSVLMQQMDFGLVSGRGPFQGIDVLHQTALPYQCLIAQGHSLANSEMMNIDVLAGHERFVVMNTGNGGDMPDFDKLTATKIARSSRLTVSDPQLAAGLVRETGALAILDPFTAEIAVRMGGVVSRPMRQNLTYNLSLITRGWDAMTREARALALAFVERLEKQDTTDL